MRPLPFYFRQLMHVPGRGLVVHEWAQGGLSSVTYREFYLERKKKWRRIRPQAILLQLGTNDVPAILEGRYSVENFENNLTGILEEFKAFRSRDGRRPLLLVATVPLFSDVPPESRKNRLVASLLNPAVRRAARHAEAAVVDNCRVLENRPEFYDPDGVHPNRWGETALARNWTRSLRAALSGPGGGRR